MTTTITHDPDGSRGCNACPFFHGVSWAGECRALPDAEIASASSGRFAPDPDCPLRNGGVNVRGPETIPADHHEPARGDAVQAEATPGVKRGSALEALRGAARGDETVADTARRLASQDGTLASIATALGMDPGALPGAIVERVEMLQAELAALRDAEPCCGNYRGAHSEEQGHHCLSCDESFPMTTRSEAIAEAVAEARQEERELLVAADDAVRSALGAREDETTLDAARRVVAEKERWRDVEHDAISDVLDATLGTYAADHGAVEAVKRLAKLYTDEQAGGEATAALLGLEADEVHRIAERIETLRLYLARAIRGCDFKERRAIEADLRAEGVTPPGVLVSAEDAAKVRGVLLEAEADYELEPVVKAWIAAGRPLASEGGE